MDQSLCVGCCELIAVGRLLCRLVALCQALVDRHVGQSLLVESVTLKDLQEIGNRLAPVGNLNSCAGPY